MKKIKSQVVDSVCNLNCGTIRHHPQNVRGIKYGMSPLVEKVGGGTCPPPVPHQIAPMGGCVPGGGWGLSIFRCGSWRPNTLIYTNVLVLVFIIVCITESVLKRSINMTQVSKYGESGGLQFPHTPLLSAIFCLETTKSVHFTFQWLGRVCHSPQLLFSMLCQAAAEDTSVWSLSARVHVCVCFCVSSYISVND